MRRASAEDGAPFCSNFFFMSLTLPLVTGGTVLPVAERKRTPSFVVGRSSTGFEAERYTSLALGREPAMAGCVDQEEEGEEEEAEVLLVVEVALVLVLLEVAGGAGRLSEAAEAMGPCAGVSPRACFAIPKSKPR